MTSKAHAQGSELERLVDIAQPQPDWIVLDVATGGGHTALAFAPYVAWVVATDVTPRMLEKAEAYVTSQGVTNVEFKPADAVNLPFEDETFDLVTCRIAPHHFPDVPRALKEFHRVLRRGGRMVIIDTLLPLDPEIAEFYQTMEKMRDPTHIRAYTEEEWRQMIEDAELILHETRILPKQHDFHDWARRAGMSKTKIQELNRFFMDAPAKIHDYFQIESFAGEVETYTDQKLLIYATRKEKEKK